MQILARSSETCPLDEPCENQGPTEVHGLWKFPPPSLFFLGFRIVCGKVCFFYRLCGFQKKISTTVASPYVQKRLLGNNIADISTLFQGRLQEFVHPWINRFRRFVCILIDL